MRDSLGFAGRISVSWETLCQKPKSSANPEIWNKKNDVIK